MPGHKCSGKGKSHYIEVYSDSGDEGDETNQEQEGLQRLSENICNLFICGYVRKPHYPLGIMSRM